MVCTKTLYNYVDLGLLPIKNIDLPEKLRRNTKAKKARENKKILGRSIEERPEIVEFRTEFGHWEIDTVIGKIGENEPCVLTLVERMTRMCIWVKARNHTAEAINEALQKVMSYFAEQRDQVFKTITGDNGSELAGLSLLEDGKLKVYFTHPYSSCEKGSNECHNRMLTKSASLPTVLTACREKFSITPPPRNCLTVNSTVFTQRDPLVRARPAGCRRSRTRFARLALRHPQGVESPFYLNLLLF